MTASLPAALAPWASTLSALHPKFAVSLGPLLRVLDDLTSRHDHDSAESGILDGYSGIMFRGAPERILASEWALADEFPMEFFRRAAGGELLYTAPAYQAERKRGRVAVLVDAGPDQLGAGRLVQLAALIVLQRRAIARGGDLTVGILGDRIGAWQEGELPKLLRTWLIGRRRFDPDPADVIAWGDRLADADEMWLLTGPRLAKRLPGRPNMIVSTEARWDAEGATAVRITLDEITTELPLPDRHLSVNALRGAAFRNSESVDGRSNEMRFPTFSSADPRLLARGDSEDVLISVYVPNKPKQTSKVRRHRFPGPVLAASYLGGRLVALIAVHGELRVHVVGKSLGRLDRLVKPIHQLGIDVSQTVHDGLLPVYFQAGDLICQMGGTWWRLTPDDESPVLAGVKAMAPGAKLDEPRGVHLGENDVYVDGRALKSGRQPYVLLGGRNLVAWSSNRITWTVEGSEQTITVDEGAQMLGLLRLNSVPTFITLSRGSLIVRAVSAVRRQTLSKWSGMQTAPIVHPILPWIAVQRSPTAIDVGNLATGETLLRVRNES